MKMTTDAEIFTALAAPFPAEAIHWRVGATLKDKSKGIGLAYITARELMDRLDDVVGPSEWGDAYSETPSGRVICSLAVRINGEWLIKSDGAGDTGMEGEKGGISDAFKRAGVKFGVGRYLYRLENEWYPIKPAGKSYKLASTPKLPAWALPDKLKSEQPEKLEYAPDEIALGREYEKKSRILMEPEKKEKREKFDPSARIIKWCDRTTQLLGFERTDKLWVDLLRRNSEHSHGCLSLKDMKKNRDVSFSDLRKISDRAKEMFITASEPEEK
jgi:hypothetical protein